MTRFTQLVLLVGACLFTAFAHARCTFKVINHGDVTFADSMARGSIGNLAIPLCKNPEDESDPLARENCAPDRVNILYTHPQAAITCQVTNGWPVMLQFEEDGRRVCYSKNGQATMDKDVVLNFPQDFVCEERGGE